MLFTKERQEQSVSIALFVKSDKSELLPSFFLKERQERKSVVFLLSPVHEYGTIRQGFCIHQTFAHPTSPCSVCRILQLPDCLTEEAGGEVGWANVWKTQGGVVRSLTNIYSLVSSLSTSCTRISYFFFIIFICSFF